MTQTARPIQQTWRSRGRRTSLTHSASRTVNEWLSNGRPVPLMFTARRQHRRLSCTQAKATNRIVGAKAPSQLRRCLQISTSLSFGLPAHTQANTHTRASARVCTPRVPRVTDISTRRQSRTPRRVTARETYCQRLESVKNISSVQYRYIGSRPALSARARGRFHTYR